jgi:hypothetical protein
MTVSEISALSASAEVVTTTPARGWIESPAFDLAFFTFSPLVGLVIIILSLSIPHGLLIPVAASFLLGMPHYLSTFTFYLGDENRAHYLSRPFAFVVAPLAIVGAIVALRMLHLDKPVILAMFLWNIYHVSLQSNGILSIYRRINGGVDAERNLAKVALMTTATAMTLWQPATFPPLYDALQWIRPGLYVALTYAFIAAGTIATITLFAKIASRPRRISFAEGSFFISSLLLFHPYLWVHDGNLATLGMLCGHFIQYLVIVWMLNFRKYAAAARGSQAQRFLSAVSARPALIFAWILCAGIAVYGLSGWLNAVGLAAASVIILNSLALVHFYLDGRIWAFKEPFVRRTMSPYLTPETRRVA